MSDRLNWIEEELAILETRALRRYKTTRESPPVGGMVQVDGRQFINFGSNDYLGIAASHELVESVHAAIGQLGFGTGASPAVSGRGTLHRKLELELADFEQTESALLFPTGFAANVGTICSLVGHTDIVYSDELNHASIIDGCRLSGAEIAIYPHADVSRLNEIMESSDNYRRRLIVTDSLFSMDGNIAPLRELCHLAEIYQAMVMVDEAHATGVFGEGGRGCCELLGVEEKVDVRIGTLSKALGCFGGFVAGKKILTDWIYNRARSYVFSTAPPEIISAAAIAALKIVREQPNRRIELLTKSNKLRQHLQQAGLNTGASESQIIPLMVGSSDRVIRHARRLAEAGIYAPAIRPPTVPDGQSRLRISLSFSHTEPQLEKLVIELVSSFASDAGK